MPSGRTRDYDYDAIANDYREGIYLLDIAEKHGCSQDTVSRIVKLFGLSRIGNFDDKFFDIIDTEEKAYWLGFLTADGCVGNKNNEISIALSIVDIMQLIKFNKSLRSDHKISQGIKKDGKKTCRTSLSSKHMKNILIDYGITPNKSFNCEPIKIPEVVPYELERHYWRGLIDGDGCIMIDKRPRMSIGLCGSLNIVIAFINYCKGLCGSNISPVFNRNIYYATVSGRNSIYICDELYREATIFLERKNNIYLRCKETIYA